MVLLVSRSRIPALAPKHIKRGYINTRGLRAESARRKCGHGLYTIGRARSYHSPKTKWSSVEQLIRPDHIIEQGSKLFK